MAKPTDCDFRHDGNSLPKEYSILMVRLCAQNVVRESNNSHSHDIEKNSLSACVGLNCSNYFRPSHALTKSCQDFITLSDNRLAELPEQLPNRRMYILYTYF
jgi:hypothetical protein